MHLDMHDADPKDSLAGRWHRLEYPYQVEEAVKTSERYHPDVVCWVAFADSGAELARWERRDGKAVMVNCSPAWKGTWRPSSTTPEAERAFLQAQGYPFEAMERDVAEMVARRRAQLRATGNLAAPGYQSESRPAEEQASAVVSPTTFSAAAGGATADQVLADIQGMVDLVGLTPKRRRGLGPSGVSVVFPSEEARQLFVGGAMKLYGVSEEEALRAVVALVWKENSDRRVAEGKPPLGPPPAGTPRAQVMPAAAGAEPAIYVIDHDAPEGA